MKRISYFGRKYGCPGAPLPDEETSGKQKTFWPMKYFG
jgi:hypothetical protein